MLMPMPRTKGPGCDPSFQVIQLLRLSSGRDRNERERRARRETEREIDERERDVGAHGDIVGEGTVTSRHEEHCRGWQVQGPYVTIA